MRPRQSHFAPRASFALFWLFLLASILAAQPARAQNYKFKVLHTFHGSPKDGAGPGGQGSLARDGAGNLYGTTGSGGEQACGKYPCGTAFKLDKNGKEVWVHTFQRKNGLGPQAGLLLDATGNLYGTTERRRGYNHAEIKLVAEQCSDWMGRDMKPCSTS